MVNVIVDTNDIVQLTPGENSLTLNPGERVTVITEETSEARVKVDAVVLPMNAVRFGPFARAAVINLDVTGRVFLDVRDVVNLPKDAS